MSTSQRPAPGRIVLYTIADRDEAQANDLNAGGNPVRAGDVYPAIVVCTFGGQATNLKVLLDGPGILWATSRTEGEGPGTWAWPPRV